jgi:hypothetical protein
LGKLQDVFVIANKKQYSFDNRLGIAWANTLNNKRYALRFTATKSNKGASNEKWIP